MKLKLYLLVMVVAVGFVMWGWARVEETERRFGQHSRDVARYQQVQVYAEAKEYWGEAPTHEVGITRPFYLGRTEVTQGQWQALMGEHPRWTPKSVRNVLVQSAARAEAPNGHACVGGLLRLDQALAWTPRPRRELRD